jgi:hypothetical protein
VTTNGALAASVLIPAVTVTCPVGKVLLGGGAFVSNTQGADRVVLVGSRPSAANTWQATAVTTAAISAANSVTVTAYAICTA